MFGYTNCMITSANRFHGYNALRSVYTRGLTVRGPLMALKYVANPRRSSYRAAVVVSRKVHKSAVVRNRIRRRIFEILRNQEPYMGQAHDIVITAFSDQLAVVPAGELQDQITSALERAGIVVNNPANTVGHDIVDAKKGV